MSTETDELFSDPDELALLDKVRGAFVPREGSFLLFADWKQVEMRIFALYAKERALLATFDYGLDVYRITTLATFGMLHADKGSLEYKLARNKGKEVALSLLYGIGPKLLGTRIDKTAAEARALMDTYFRRFPSARGFMRAVEQQILERGWIKNRWGRRYYIPPERSYIGVNSLVQGTAADLMKDVLARVHGRLDAEGLRTRLLLTVHDELILDVPYGEARAAVAVLREEMRSDRLAVPLQIDLGWAPVRWSEKYPLGCGACDGFGRTLNVDQDDLLRALLDGDAAFVATAALATCGRCGGTGLDTGALEAEIARRGGTR